MGKMRVCLLVMLLGMVGCLGASSGDVKVAEEESVVLPKTPIRGEDGVYQHTMDSTVALMGRNEDGKVVPYCTGVWVSETEILTAAHCVAIDELGILPPIGYEVHYIIRKEVRKLGEEPAAMHLAHVKYFNSRHDLAVLKAVVDGIPGHSVVELATELPGVGEAVHVVGHPRGLFWTLTNGVVSAYRADSVVGPVMQVNGTVWFGNSGGGVFDSKGRLLGIASRLAGVPNMAYFVHLDSVKRALEVSGRK